METEDGRLNAYHCYYEHNVEKAYQRFNNSEEWEAVRGFLANYQLPNNRVLDLGAGNGIASYAFINSGYSVVSIEPDGSNLTGYGAMKNFKKSHGFPFRNISGIGELLPIKQKTFSLVYCRQVLHHANDLQKMMEEISRVLVPGGIFLATREHVIDDQKSLEKFLANHPLHEYTKAEHAYTISDYLSAINKSGLNLVKLLLSWDSVINHYPTSNSDLKEKIAITIKKDLD
jgi:SAM-dependent methyltransferase